MKAYKRNSMRIQAIGTLVFHKEWEKAGEHKRVEIFLLALRYAGLTEQPSAA